MSFGIMHLTLYFTSSFVYFNLLQETCVCGREDTNFIEICRFFIYWEACSSWRFVNFVRQYLNKTGFSYQYTFTYLSINQRGEKKAEPLPPSLSPLHPSTFQPFCASQCKCTCVFLKPAKHQSSGGLMRLAAINYDRLPSSTSSFPSSLPFRAQPGHPSNRAGHYRQFMAGNINCPGLSRLQESSGKSRYVD